jgi:secreted trypsin-like serine protease
MLPRIARAGALLLCTAICVGVLADTASARAPRARASVIGGNVATLTDWGFAAAVFTPNSLCTGVVISPTRVLTAAHCVGSLPTMLVRANSTNAFSGGDVLQVTGVAIAPGYANGFVNDLAVLTLRSPTSATPIQLATAAEDASYTQQGAPLAAAGFGDRNPLIIGKRQIGLLTSADVLVRNCGPLPSSTLCDAGGRAGVVVRRLPKEHRRLRRQVNKVICEGDSGGPLIARTPAGPKLIGITEASSSPTKRNPFFFVRCGLHGFPSLHTRVASFLSFIQANLGP